MSENISIIGMAGVGKSFTAKRLADCLDYEYIEVDKLITERAQRIGIDKSLLSDNAFMELEENAILSLKNKYNTIIDTGGSVIYSAKAMKMLCSISFVVYLADSLEHIGKRFNERGEPHLIGMVPGTSFEKLFTEREILYEKYADIKINVAKNTDVVIVIQQNLSSLNKRTIFQEGTLI